MPFSNRIAQATLLWQGTQHPLVRNNGAEPHAIHGVGWQRPWEVLESDSDFAMLAYEHRPDAAWPFAFDSSQTLRLRGGTLELTLSLTNQSQRPAPAGLGWHPYFVKRGRSRISFEATGRWEMGPDKLPTAAAPRARAGRRMRVSRCRPLLRRLERHRAPARRTAAHARELGPDAGWWCSPTTRATSWRSNR